MVNNTVFFNTQKKRIVALPRVLTPRANRERPGQGAGAGAGTERPAGFRGGAGPGGRGRSLAMA